MKHLLVAAMVCVSGLSAQAQNNNQNCLTFHGYPAGLGTYEYERSIGNYITSKVPPVVPEANPALILGAMFLVGAAAWELKRRGSLKVQA
jgi:uncharacterized membrane protein